MLIPHKYMNVEKSVLKMSSEMVKIFLKNYIIEFDDLYKIMEEKFDIEVYELFIPALNLLYCLGKVNYIVKEDVLEWKMSEN